MCPGWVVLIMVFGPFSQAVDEMSERFVDAVKEDLKLVGGKEEDVEDKG